MASPSSVITGGFGTPGSASLIITDGYGIGATPVVVTPATTTSAGVRRARFLRRAPKLPWEVEDEPEEQQISIAPPRKKRIPMPAVKAMEAIRPIPIQTVKEIDAPVIKIPEIGIAVLEDDEDDWLWLI